MSFSESSCNHLNKIEDIIPTKEYECEECMKTNDLWVHLRTCQECGSTLCCDSSPNMHASKHALNTGHEVVASAEPGERWLYCYADDLFLEY